MEGTAHRDQGLCPLESCRRTPALARSEIMGSERKCGTIDQELTGDCCKENMFYHAPEEKEIFTVG